MDEERPPQIPFDSEDTSIEVRLEVPSTRVSLLVKNKILIYADEGFIEDMRKSMIMFANGDKSNIVLHIRIPSSSSTDLCK